MSALAWMSRVERWMSQELASKPEMDAEAEAEDALAAAWAQGHFRRAAQVLLARPDLLPKPEGLFSDDDDEKDADGVLADWLARNDMASHHALTLLAVSCLQYFVQLNWTGLAPAEADEEDVRLPWAVSAERLQHDLADTHGAQGWSENVRRPELLWLARRVLAASTTNDGAKNACSKLWLFDWWRLRSILVLQQILDEKSDQLYQEALAIIERVSGQPAWQALEIDDKQRQLHVHWHLEVAHFHATFYEVNRVREHVDRAAELAGFRIKETGAMGKRTHFQVRDLAQLTLDITSKGGDDDDDGEVNDSGHDLPVDLKLDDEVRMNQVKFSDSGHGDAFSRIPPTGQAILLAVFTLKQRSQPNDELTAEELMPYLGAILAASRTSWALRMSALLLRSKLESKSRRTVERSLMQVQTLVDSTAAAAANSSDGRGRLRAVYSSRLPPAWEVETELCRLLLSLGSTKAALDVALRLCLWEDVIHCYHQLSLRHKAADVIRAQLEKKETPRLYCMLGDATDELEHYRKALELSGDRSARAYRSLGVYHYYKQDYPQAVDYLKKSLERSSFQLSTLLRLGYSAMQIEDWETAAQAYRSYCNYESDNFEAWNNLSNAYVKQGQKARAWKVLQEAVKCDYDNWKIWDNIMVVSTDCAHFEEVLRAYHRILDLKEKHVDAQVLGILVRAIADDLADSLGRPSRRQHLEPALKLFGRLTSQLTTDGAVWLLYADLVAVKAEGDGGDDAEMAVKACQYLQKATACFSQKAGWDKDDKSCEEVIGAALKYGQATIRYTQSNKENATRSIQMCSSAKMSLRGILAKVKQSQTSVSTGEIVDQLRPMTTELAATVEQLTSLVSAQKVA